MADTQALLPMRLPRRKRTAADRFKDFHRANPAVLEVWVRYSREAKAAGWGTFPASIVARRVEYHLSVEAGDPRPDVLRIRPAYVPRYARLAMKECGDLAGLFVTRRLRLRGE